MYNRRMMKQRIFANDLLGKIIRWTVFIIACLLTIKAVDLMVEWIT